MNALAKNMPLPTEVVYDQRQLNGAGPAAYRHELEVPLPEHLLLPATPWALGEPDDTSTWTEVREMPSGRMILRVVRTTSAYQLTSEERGVITGELAEAWWNITVSKLALGG